MADEKPDFTGWVTKNDLRCSDGKTIRHGAFKHMDNAKVPLVWRHDWSGPSSILGHVVLQHRDDGVYGLAYFNDTPAGQDAKLMVQHGDITALSIHANHLKMRGSDVLDGVIREVSLVLAGANPGAFIDQVSLAHGDGSEIDDVIIYTGLTIEHSDKNDEESGDNMAEENADERTVQDVFDEMTEEQQKVVFFLVGQALEDQQNSSEEPSKEGIKHSDDGEYIEHASVSTDEFLSHIGNSIKEGFEDMTRNVFEQNGSAVTEGPTLSHEQLVTIVEDAKKLGSFKESFLQHAQNYGIENIDILFPDAKTLTTEPDFIKRRTEWVDLVLSKTKHSPFGKVKSVVADITAEEARARGYVKNTMKKDEVIRLLKRTTSPTTVYKKQKIDRDDVIDITDLDVITWIKAEMRLMLDEELARAILIGDGRDSDDADKIKDPTGAQDGVGIRSIANDADMYAHKVYINKDLGQGTLVEAVLRSRTHYRGTGVPTFFTTDAILTDALLEKDKIGRRIYESVEALANAMRVSEIVPVEVMEYDPEMLGIMVSLVDYTIGADKGGQLSMFDDFDIDWNQFKYLMETRISGGLTKPKSAIVFKRTGMTEVVPPMPSYNSTTHKITIPTVAGVEYRIDDDIVTGEVTIDKDTDVEAYPKTGYVFKSNVTTNWAFTF